MKDDNTGFRFYSFGIVAEDKVGDDDHIKVFPVEELPLTKGRVIDVKNDYTSKAVDHKGVSSDKSVTGVAFVVARWLPFDNGNRITAPNVVEGETIMLVKTGSETELHWIDMGREPRLRRLENIVTALSNLVKKGEAFDQDSSYWMQVSTRDKLLKLHTSTNDKEKAGYDITINTAEGTFELIDTLGNSIFLDSVNGNLKMDINESIEMNTKQVRINGVEYVRTTGEEISDKAGSKAVYNSGGTWDADSGGTINLHKTTKVDGQTNATEDVTAGSVSLQGHDHDYKPGGGSPTPTSKPNA